MMCKIRWKKKISLFFIIFAKAMFTITLTQCVTSILKYKNGFAEFPGTCMEIQYRLFNPFPINQKLSTRNRNSKYYQNVTRLYL